MSDNLTPEQQTAQINGTTPPNTVVFEWKLNADDFKKSIFEKKKMYEIVNINKIYGFIKNKMGINYGGIKRYKFLPYKNELQFIEKYKTIYDRRNERFNTGYTLPKHKWGRITPNDYLSLSIAHRPTRHSLSDEFYIDIDMINAQPRITEGICKHHNINTPNLTRYINERDVILNFIKETHNCDRDTAKNLLIVLMFGGSYDGWIREHNIQQGDKIDIIEGVENEMSLIMETVYTNNKHIETAVLKQDPTKWKTVNEKKRGVMALWAQSIERLLQETAIKFLIDSKGLSIESIVPCQDGFMILKDDYYTGIIEDIENVIKINFNIDMKFKVKDFDEKYEIPIYEDEKTIAEWEDIISYKRLGDRFIEDFDKYIKMSDECLYIYWGIKNADKVIVNGRWYNETNDKKRYKMTLYISEDLYENVESDIRNAVELNDDDIDKLLRILRIHTTGNSMTNVMKHILPKVKESEKKFDSDPFLLGFENGVYDLINDEFRNYTYDDYLTLSTRYNYNKIDYGYIQEGDVLNDMIDTYDEAQKEVILRNRRMREELCNIINTIQPNPEERDLFLQILASGLDGKLYQKMFLFNGQGGNGKGLTGAFMDNCLGDYYSQPTNGLLKEAEKPNAPSPDMYMLKGKRYINFKEVGGNIKVAILRNLTGGGQFSGRKLHQDPEKFYMTATFCMEFNNAPDLDGKPQASDYRRLTHCEFPVNFTTDPNKIGKVINGTLYLEANPYYETPEFINAMKPHFLEMLLSSYRTFRDKETPVNGIKFIIPKSVRDRSDKFIEDQNLFQKVFNDIWKKVDIKLKANGDVDREDERLKTVQVREIWESISTSEDYRKLRTSRERREYGRDEFYKWIEGLFTISGNSKTGKLIKGIIRKADDEDDIDPEPIEAPAEVDEAEVETTI
jgi:phage/plasmid-associated DNA primase